MVGVPIVDDALNIMKSANRRNKPVVLARFEDTIKKMDRLELACVYSNIKDKQLYARDFRSIILKYK